MASPGGAIRLPASCPAGLAALPPHGYTASGNTLMLFTHNGATVVSTFPRQSSSPAVGDVEAIVFVAPETVSVRPALSGGRRHGSGECADPLSQEPRPPTGLHTRPALAAVAREVSDLRGDLTDDRARRRMSEE